MGSGGDSEPGCTGSPSRRVGACLLPDRLDRLADDRLLVSHKGSEACRARRSGSSVHVMLVRASRADGQVAVGDPEPGRETCATTVNARRAVIVHLDMVGYSRLIGLDVTGTFLRLRALRMQLLDPLLRQHSGRLVQTGGDSLLVTFDSAPAAVAFATAFQSAIPLREAGIQDDRKIRFRVGIDAGNVIADSSDLHGNNVNIAVRLQTICPPGGVCISRSVYEQVRMDSPVEFRFLGAPDLKNIAESVEAFVWCSDVEPQGSAAAAALSLPSIAVLPFRMEPLREEDAYFAEGIVEDIIHVPAAQREMFVVSRTSSQKFSEAAGWRHSAATELGVRYLLSGRIRRAESKLGIRTELIDATTGIVLASDQYNGTPNELFQLQEDIAIRVAGATAPHVRELELRRAALKPPNSLTAYDLVLHALDNLYRPEAEHFARARHLLEQASTLDADYAPAYAYLAYWHMLNVGEGRSADPDVDTLAAARAAALAIERDANDALALAIYGHVQSFLLRDYDRALYYLDRAVDAGPNAPLAWSMSSATRGYLDRGPEAVRHAQRGLLLAPLDAHVFWHEGQLAQALCITGKLEDAIAIAQRLGWRRPDLLFNLRVLIASQVGAGRLAGARASAQRLMQARPDFRLGVYLPRCPFQGAVLESWSQRLRKAGLPD